MEGQIMNIYKSNRRCYEIREYIQYLNKRIGEIKDKNKLTDEDKLAKILLFNLEHYSRYEQEKGMTFTLYILDHFTDIVKDENDIFQRRKIEFHIPTKVKRNLFREYREYVKTVEMVVSASEEELAEMIENGEVGIATVKKDTEGHTVVGRDAEVENESETDEDEME